MAKVLVILTSYNRPTLVVDAIKSIVGQTYTDWRAVVVDDGSDQGTRNAILGAIPDSLFSKFEMVWLPERSMHSRKSSIPYSRSINKVINHHLRDEQYIMYLCDDDYLYPGAMANLAIELDGDLNKMAVFGRLRSVQFNAHGGRNTWDNSGPPTSGMDFPHPTGQRVWGHGGASSRYYFDDNLHVDPSTSLPYVECGFWEAGPSYYGQPYQIDHNQIMHRASAFKRIPADEWFGEQPADLGGQQYWPEAIQYGVGDAGFFRVLGKFYPFHGVDTWVVTKRYHSKSDGVCSDVVRE